MIRLEGLNTYEMANGEWVMDDKVIHHGRKREIDKHGKDLKIKCKQSVGNKEYRVRKGKREEGITWEREGKNE